MSAGRVPATLRAGRRGWTHFSAIADRKGWPLKDDERVVAALAAPDQLIGQKRRSEPGELEMEARPETRDGVRRWRVWYPDESGISTPIPVYDVDGVLVETLRAGVPTGKMVKSSFVGRTREAAVEYAYWLGATTVR